MENYKKVPKQKNEEEQIQPNEIRITSFGVMRRYISYAVALLDPSLVKQFQEEQQADTAENAEKFPTPSQQYDTIVLKAMGRAINKTVTIAEVIKRRVAGLHQITLIHSTPIVDEYEPKVEGLEKKTKTRTVSAMTITLSKNQLDKKDPGYQEPIPQDQVQPLQPIPHYDDEERPQRRKRQGRRNNRGEAKEDESQPQQQTTEQAGGGEAKQKRRRPKKNRARKAVNQEGGEQQQGEQAQTQAPQQTQQAQQPKERQPRRPKVPREQNQQQTTPQTQGVAPTGDQQQGEQSERGRGRGRGRGRRGGRGRGRGRGANTSEPTTGGVNATD